MTMKAFFMTIVKAKAFFRELFGPQPRQPGLEDTILYLHKRIDQLIRQTALEVGLLDLHKRDPNLVMHKEWRDQVMLLTKQRFWGADWAAGEEFRRRFGQWRDLPNDAPASSIT